MKSPPIDTAEWEAIAVRLNPRQGFCRHPEKYHISTDWFRETVVDFDLWCAFGGSELITSPQGEEHEFRRGKVLFVRPGESWSTRYNPDYPECLQMAFFHFDLVNRKSGLKLGSDDLPGIPSLLNCHEPDFVESLCRRLIQLGLLWRAKNNYFEEPAYKLACDLMHGLLRDVCFQHQIREMHTPGLRDHHHLSRLMKIGFTIREDPCRFASVADMAHSINVSPDHFTRLFKGTFNMSPVDALIASKMDRARLLLSSTPLSIVQISEELGYDTPAYFSRQFKSRNGVSPSVYRNALRKMT